MNEKDEVKVITIKQIGTWHEKMQGQTGGAYIEFMRMKGVTENILLLYHEYAELEKKCAEKDAEIERLKSVYPLHVCQKCYRSFKGQGVGEPCPFCRCAELEKSYHELIYAVGMKYRGRN